MELTAQQITDNWNKFISNIKEFISEPRQTQLLDFYQKYEERFAFMPASHKKEFHGCFAGGYILHINRVVEASIKLHSLWSNMGSAMDTFTFEELIFSAINHDLGKFGTYDSESYIEQTDEWRKNKLDEHYMFNKEVPFASVPDRTLFILQDQGIKYTFNEMIAIQTHDGLYDEANKKYLQGFLPEQKPRSSIVYILHQADMIASRIEFEQEYAHKFDFKADNIKVDKVVASTKTVENIASKSPKKQAAMKTVGSSGLFNLLNEI